MGALHAGHLGLVERARVDADFVVASVFVNPTQFAPHEDLAQYPRTWDADYAALSRAHVDVVYAPTAAAMYPPRAPFRTFVSPAHADETTPEGGARPGFFRGVATVVTKLLGAVRPTVAVFGQKDGVQCIVVRALVRDLNVPTVVRVAPTARETDGLAMSSRNAYLSAAQRARAGVIFRALERARTELDASGEVTGARAAAAEKSLYVGRGVDDDTAAGLAAQRAAFAANDVPASRGHTAPPSPLLARVADAVRAEILAEPTFSTVDYVTFSDALTGGPVTSLRDSTARGGAILLSVAARTGSTRLLDNIVLVGDVSDLGAAPGEADEPVK